MTNKEKFLEFTPLDERHLCDTCKKCPRDGDTTVDEHACRYAYDQWETIDNGGGYWVVKCPHYQRFNEKEFYKQWIMSDRWKRISAEKKRLAGYQCEMCKSAINLCVHHTTYKHIGYEDRHLDELIVLCDACHKKVHEKDLREGVE